MITLKQLLDVCSRLNEKRVQYVVIGGWAVYLHGYERATRDIDIIVNDDDANVERIKDALADVLPEACAELHAHDVRENAVVRMAGEDLVIDLMKGVGEYDYERLEDHAQHEMINGVSVPFADLESMLELKGGVRDVDQRDYLFLKGKRAYLSGEK